MNKKKYSNIHQKNVMKLCTYLQEWLEAELSELNVFECGFVYANYETEKFIFLNSNLSWRYRFLDKDLDLELPPLFKVGAHYLSEDHPIKQVYNESFKSDCFKMCFGYRYGDGGFDLLSVSSLQPLSLNEQALILRKFRTLAHELHKVIKMKIDGELSLPLRMTAAMQVQHEAQKRIEEPALEQSAKFDGFKLTAREIRYIEYAMLGITHKEIAKKYDCTMNGVAAIYVNIRRKLGNYKMSSAEMFQALRAKGVLRGIASRLLV